MKNIFIVALSTLAFTASAQDKYHHIQFNNLMEVAGTDYVIASIDNRGKIFDTSNRDLVYINTRTGETTQIDFPENAILGRIEQVKIDSLEINCIVVGAKTTDRNQKNGIDSTDPLHIVVLSTDGKEKTQLTDSSFSVNTWIVNNSTGTLVVTGHLDTNNNFKYDKTDTHEIHIYDLRSLKLMSKS